MNDGEPPALPCAGKLAFDTRNQAQAEATATHWRRGTSLKPYRCRHCDLWHLSKRIATDKLPD